MRQSKDNFVNEYITRRNAKPDKEYLFLSDFESYDSVKRALALFDRMRDYLFHNTKLTRDGFTVSPPKSIEFDYKLGWQLENDEAHVSLGKLNIEHSINLVIGHGTYFSGETSIYGKGPFSIGNFCGIASGTNFFTSEDRHPLGYLSHFNLKANRRVDKVGLGHMQPNYPDTPSSGIVIGHNVWIARNATIKQRVKIGNGSIIGESSYVNKHINAYSLNVGIPCRRVRYLYSQDLINSLEVMSWWFWSDEKIRKNRALFENPIELQNLDNIK